MPPDRPDEPRSARLPGPVTCHAWDSHRRHVAVCLDSEVVHVYDTAAPGAWKRVATLRGHEQLVSGVDWAAGSGRIVTCSHDRNAFVWVHKDGQWTSEMVLTRLARGATCVQWSSCERKFAIGSSAKAISICTYDAGARWWAANLARGVHSSAVVAVAWHPGRPLLATTSIDGTARLLHVHVPGVDPPNSAVPGANFGDVLQIFDFATGWCHAVAWSPSGAQLAVSTHGTVVHFVAALDGWLTAAGMDGGRDAHSAPSVHSVRHAHPPLRALAFAGERALVAGSFDGRLYMMASTAGGRWGAPSAVSREVTEGCGGNAGPASPVRAGIKARLAIFAPAPVFQGARQAAETVREGRASRGMPWAGHAGAIVQVQVCGGHKGRRTVSSAGVDGRILMWDVSRCLCDSPDRS